MKFVPCDKKDLKLWKPGKNQAIILEFWEGDYDCVKVEDYPQTTAKGCQSALIMAATRLGLSNRVKVVILIKIDEEDT